MAQTHKRLATSRPSAAVNTTAYTAPASTKAMITSILVCNTGAAETIRIFLVPSGDSAGVANALYYDVVVAAGDVLGINMVPILETGDALVVYALNGTATFTISGMEIT